MRAISFGPAPGPDRRVKILRRPDQNRILTISGRFWRCIAEFDGRTLALDDPTLESDDRAVEFDDRALEFGRLPNVPGNQLTVFDN
jgi:hypothetical protein